MSFPEGIQITTHPAFRVGSWVRDTITGAPYKVTGTSRGDSPGAYSCVTLDGANVVVATVHLVNYTPMLGERVVITKCTRQPGGGWFPEVGETVTYLRRAEDGRHLVERFRYGICLDAGADAEFEPAPENVRIVHPRTVGTCGNDIPKEFEPAEKPELVRLPEGTPERLVLGHGDERVEIKAGDELDDFAEKLCGLKREAGETDEALRERLHGFIQAFNSWKPPRGETIRFTRPQFTTPRSYTHGETKPGRQLMRLESAKSQLAGEWKGKR